MVKIDFFNTAVSKEAITKVGEVLSSTFLSEGKLVAEFETALFEKTGDGD